MIIFDAKSGRVESPHVHEGQTMQLNSRRRDTEERELGFNTAQRD